MNHYCCIIQRQGKAILKLVLLVCYVSRTHSFLLFWVPGPGSFSAETLCASWIREINLLDNISSKENGLVTKDRLQGIPAFLEKHCFG